MKLHYILLTGLLASNTLANPALQSGTSWDGGAIAYPQGKAQITAKILRLEEGKAAPFHCHPVPTMGYVIRGTAEVETAAGEKIVIGPGQPLVEVMRTVHRGIALDGPVEIMVFYAGAEGVPNTVLPADDPEERYCDA